MRVPVTAGILVCTLAPAPADTVRLKEGGIIADCMVAGEENDLVVIRTPGGRMGIPKEAIRAIEKGKTVFDAFQAKKKTIKMSIAASVFQLAQWCREKGLRIEMNESLERMIELDPEHAEARHLLGYAKIDGEWRLQPPLLLLLRPTGEKGKDLEEERRNEVRDLVREQLAILLETRKDIFVVEKLGRAGEMDGCEFTAAIARGGHDGTTFYGQKVLDAEASCSATFTAAAPWIGRTPLSATVTGTVAKAHADPDRLAFIDAMTRNAKVVHDLLDSIVLRRVQRIEARAAGQEEEKEDSPKAATGTGAKKATAKKAPAKKR